MAKIRGVKPDYWTDEDIVGLSIPARLLFIGLWSYACDNGHLQDKSKQIKMRVMPGDDVNAAELLRELADNDRILREDGWIIIPNFTKHQKPDKRYFQTCDRDGCERPPLDSRPGTRGGLVGETPGLVGGSKGPHVDGDCDGEGDGDGEVRATKVAKRATAFPDDFKPTDKHLALAAEHGVNLRAEWPNFKDHHTAKGSTFKNWDAALNTWIRNAPKFGGGARPAVVPVDDSWQRRRPS